MEGGEINEPPRFCIEVNVPRGGWKLAVLWLHHGTTLQSAAEANCKGRFPPFRLKRSKDRTKMRRGKCSL